MMGGGVGAACRCIQNRERKLNFIWGCGWGESVW